ncbi:zinc-binding alcohol dehydrogenase family protein [Biostraticola tofi]|uniref:Zinc-type alcohol dehydrogenase-like protein n=1 Tax=Biostraticola tofi TaxID=466109 RepID=A0A4V6P454_9GAMM|nr:zinc-binding alcohol dehydrogenase family protein [Biostraticola tofi]TCV95079.1 zinc-binding alcohol dehydrogenase family protein [Biostraticola tofi]
MKAIVYAQHGLPIASPDSLYSTDLPTPRPGPRDLLVAVNAISVNPVDTKVRANAAVTAPRVLGWDVAGVVLETGSDVTLFNAGDEVFYAGSLTRPGANSELHLVDERIVGHKPASIDFAHAAALPLTAITAWELLFDRLRVAEGGGENSQLLIIGAAGGVGSILTQLARKLTRMTVIGTASRPETAEWVRKMGAHHVIDHSKSLAEELSRIGIHPVSHVASLTHTESHYKHLIDVLAPQGQLALIDDPKSLDANQLKTKSLSLHWEFMFTRAMFETSDMIKQHQLLERVAALVDDGTLQSTFSEHYGAINAENLRRAHQLIESHRARGKIVLEGFDLS